MAESHSSGVVAGACDLRICGAWCGTGCDSGFTHSQVFVYFQWIVTVGNVVHHLRVDTDIVGCDVSGQLVHLFLPGEIHIFQAVDVVLAKTVILRSGEHKIVIGTLAYYLIEQVSVKAGTVYRTHISDDRAWNVLHVTGCFVFLGRIVQL